jgi:predicted RNA-binding protein YlqC (UPF0109 family)
MTDVEKAIALEMVLREMVMGMVCTPAAVVLGMTVEDKSVLFEVRANSHDTGRLIGRGGRTARSLRTVLRSCAVKMGINVELNIASSSSCADGEGLASATPAERATEGSDGEQA